MELDSLLEHLHRMKDALGMRIALLCSQGLILRLVVLMGCLSDRL